MTGNKTLPQKPSIVKRFKKLINTKYRDYHGLVLLYAVYFLREITALTTLLASMLYAIANFHIKE